MAALYSKVLRRTQDLNTGEGDSWSWEISIIINARRKRTDGIGAAVATAGLQQTHAGGCSNFKRVGARGRRG